MQNTFGNKGPAVAATINGDKSAVFNCGFLGYQDTLSDAMGRHYFKNCYIQGEVDFIFGQAQSYFEVIIIMIIFDPKIMIIIIVTIIIITIIHIYFLKKIHIYNIFYCLKTYNFLFLFIIIFSFCSCKFTTFYFWSLPSKSGRE